MSFTETVLITLFVFGSAMFIYAAYIFACRENKKASLTSPKTGRSKMSNLKTLNTRGRRKTGHC